MKKNTITWSIGLLILLLLSQSAQAAVSPGDVINQSNWEQAKEMVADQILDLVKAGKMELNIGRLDYEPENFWLPGVEENIPTNRGRYAVDEAGNLVEKASGKKYPPALRNGGLPFSELSPDVPNIGWKLMYNNFYHTNIAVGGRDMMIKWLTVGSKGLELSAALETHWYIPKPDDGKYEYMVIVKIREPYDLAGITSLSRQPVNPDVGTVRYTYFPGTRKTRRMPSSTASSEDYYGHDNAEDYQSWGGPYYKIRDAAYDLMDTKEMLVPFVSTKAGALQRLDKGGVAVDIDAEHQLRFGFETEGWTGAPWALSNIVWVKRKVYQVRYTPRNDPDYLFGPGIGWVDAATFNPVYRITNNADDGKLRSVSIYPSQGYKTADGAVKWMTVPAYLTINLKKDTATLVSYCGRKGDTYRFLLGENHMSKKMFSKSGFVRFCR